MLTETKDPADILGLTALSQKIEGWRSQRPRSRSMPEKLWQEASEAADFRCGIDGLSQRCRSVLNHNPFAGTVIVFRNRAGKAIKLLVYDGQGFWLCYKRMSASRFRFWPSSPGEAAKTLLAHELQVLIFGGDPLQAHAAPVWRPVNPTGA